MSSMKKDIKKIAIVRLSALGDIVNSAFVLQFIQDAYPNAKISWVIEESFSDILSLAPEISNTITLNLKRLKKEKKIALLRKEIQKLRAYNDFDIIIDMQGLLKSAIVSRILGKKIHGFDKNSTRESVASLFYTTKSTIAYEQNVIIRNAKIINDALDLNITKEKIAAKRAVFQLQECPSLPNEKKNIAFVIGASWPSKIYPKEKVADVCNTLDANIYIIWGSESEKADAQWILKHTKNTQLAPKCTLRELVGFISAMDLLIGNDTGPTHIAWAQNIPSITLFGPTTARMIAQSKKNIAIESPSDVDILNINKNDFSIKTIAPSLITKKAKELLYGL
jgi:heptosyltransferase-1